MPLFLVGQILEEKRHNDFHGEAAGKGEQGLGSNAGLVAHRRDLVAVCTENYGQFREQVRLGSMAVLEGQLVVDQERPEPAVLVLLVDGGGSQLGQQRSRGEWLGELGGYLLAVAGGGGDELCERHGKKSLTPLTQATLAPKIDF